MSNTTKFLNAGAVAIIFFILKFIEMRFIEKENKPLKELIKDSVIVYICVLSGHYILEQLSPIIQDGGGFGTENIILSTTNTPGVFTGNPDF